MSDSGAGSESDKEDGCWAQMCGGSPEVEDFGLTQMLAENPETMSCYDVFAAVPRKAGEETESVPLTTIKVPRGMYFWLQAAIIGFVALLVGYAFSVGIGVVIAMANMAMESCGQEVWGTDADTACHAQLLNAFAMAQELRCHSGKPANMSQEDFDGACGNNTGRQIELAITLGLTLTMVVMSVRGKLMEMPTKVHFHEKLFAVESWSGKKFVCSFYADVVSARSTWRCLEIRTKAGVTLNAGGRDPEKEKGRTLTIEEDAAIEVLSGDGKAKQRFLTEFSRFLPVSIDDFDGGDGGARLLAYPAQGSASMLTGRLGAIQRARGAGPESYEAVRKPVTCDFVTELIVYTIIAVLVGYAIGLVFKVFEFATRRGENRCVDAYHPGVDLCAVWRIFMPFHVPLTNAGDYLSVVIWIVLLIGIPAQQLMQMTVGHRFHWWAGMLQEVVFCSWERQANKMIFADDVESLELVETAIEQYVSAKTKASYTVTYGISSPLKVVAKFVTTELKLSFADRCFAACSGQGDEATEHRETLMEHIEKFKPGYLDARED